MNPSALAEGFSFITHSGINFMSTG